MAICGGHRGAADSARWLAVGRQLDGSAGRGRAWQMLLATSYHATFLENRGFKVRWMTWRAISARPRHRVPLYSIDGGF